MNKEPYGNGWLFRLELSGPLDESGLLSADAYRALVESGA